MSVEIKISNFFGDDLRFVRHNNEWTNKVRLTNPSCTGVEGFDSFIISV